MYKNNEALKIHSQILLDNIDHQILSMLTRIKQNLKKKEKGLLLFDTTLYLYIC